MMAARYTTGTWQEWLGDEASARARTADDEACHVNLRAALLILALFVADLLFMVGPGLVGVLAMAGVLK